MCLSARPDLKEVVQEDIRFQKRRKKGRGMLGREYPYKTLKGSKRGRGGRDQEKPWAAYEKGKPEKERKKAQEKKRDP